MKEVGRRQSSAPPCAACKLLRRRCSPECIFAPHFPADQPQKFANVHKVFGASNVNKMLQELPIDLRADAVSSMVYEANARVRDPVYGCVGAISSLQRQVDILQTQLAMARAEAVHMQSWHAACFGHSLAGIGSGGDGSSPISSQKCTEPPAKPLFAMDTVVDQSNMGEPMWSC